MAIELLIKTTLLTRPNARRETLFVSVPFTDHRREKYDALCKAGGRFTWEAGGMLGPRVVVCIENDDADFEQRVAKDRLGAEHITAQMLDEWTPAKWRQFTDAMSGEGDDGPDENDLQGV